MLDKEIARTRIDVRTTNKQEKEMGFVITATNERGTVSTFWCTAKKIGEAYKSFPLSWSVTSKQYSRRPAGVQYHINERT